MLIAIWPAAIAVIGLLIWLLAANPKASEAGKILFICGALVLTFVLARETLRLGSAEPDPSTRSAHA